MRIKYALILLLSLLMPFFLYPEARGDELKFLHIDAREGLPQNEISWIFQDNKGFMWFCTKNGVSKYDGYNFTVFKHKPEDTTSPGHRVVIMASECQHGELWFGTYNSLDRFDRDSESFVHYRTTIKHLSQGISSPISSIHAPADQPSKIWVGTRNGLELFDKQVGTFTPDSHYAEFFKDYSGKTPQELVQDEDRNLWFIFQGGLFKYDLNRSTFKHYTHDANNPLSLGDDRINFIYKSRRQKGILWLGTESGLDKFDTESEIFTHFRHRPNDIRSLSHASVRAVAPSPVEPGVLWLVSLGHSMGNGSLNKFDTNTGDVRRYQHNPAIPFSLSSGHLSDVFQDDSGVLWVGTFALGLNKASANSGRFVHYYHDPNQKHGLNSNMIFTFCETPGTGNKVWVGSLEGLNLFDRKQGTFSHIKIPSPRPGSTSPQVRALNHVAAKPEILWIGTRRSGLYKYNTVKKSFVHYMSKPGASNTLVSNVIFVLHQSPAQPGALWIGGAQRGLMKLDIESGTFTGFPLELETHGMNYMIATIFESPDEPGIFWVGSQGRGLIRLDSHTGASQVFLQSQGDINTPGSHVIDSIHQSSSDNDILWLGTEIGLLKFNRKTHATNNTGIPTALKEIVVQAILEDDKNNLWLSSDYGLYKYKPGGEIKHYDLQDGLQGNAFHMSALKTSSGIMYFGGSNGFNVFHPGKLKENKRVPQVVITGITVFNKPVKVFDKDREGPPILKKAITEARSITLSHRDKVFGFTFAVLEYTIPGKNRYAYKMEGFDDSWHDIGHNRSATFTGLDPGKYIFRVKGSNHDGIWNETGTAIRVIILPPWWRTGWAYLLYTLGFGILLFLLNRMQRRLLVGRERHRAEVSEAKLRAQAAEAQSRTVEVEHQRKTDELEEGRKLQLSMLPQTVPQINGVEIGVFMRTATEVGGDYYDFYENKSETLTAVIGDATGHGLKAGMMVSIVKTIIMTELPYLKNDLHHFFNRSNHTIKEMRLGNLFMGLTLMRLDRMNGKAVVVSAGMPPVYRFRQDEEGGSVEEIVTKAPPIGAFSHFAYNTREIDIQVGDTLLMFTDGLPELFNESNQMFGYDRLKQLFHKNANMCPDDLIQQLVKAGEQWLSDKPQDDDITFAVLQITD
jgi:serine phosphatase RsbU (regulator of sigma subunit)/ligand-binding sensor domain-containing protein